MPDVAAALQSFRHMCILVSALAFRQPQFKAFESGQDPCESLSLPHSVGLGFRGEQLFCRMKTRRAPKCRALSSAVLSNKQSVSFMHVNF